MDNQILLVVMTNGRRDTISQSIPSALESLHGMRIGQALIHDDSGDAVYQDWLKHQFPLFEVRSTPERQGFGMAMSSATKLAAKYTDCDWVFWLEDDFTFNRYLDLKGPVKILEDNPHIMQMALLRQPWFPNEIKAGSILNINPNSYVQKTIPHNGLSWLEHRNFWTTNPHLVRRQTLVDYDWPEVIGSEIAFARKILKEGRVSGYWGLRVARPWVTHIGTERVGFGY